MNQMSLLAPNGSPISSVRVRRSSSPLVRSLCSVDECLNPIFRGPYCGAHYKRMQRGRPMTTPIGEQLSPEELVIEAGSALLECDAEDDAGYRRKRKAFIRATLQLAQAMGWRPPVGENGRGL